MEETLPAKKLLTLTLVYRDGKVLLGMKKRGFGQGRWNGFGGKVQSGESIDHAAAREIEEEAGIVPRNLTPRGILTFSFEGDPVILEVHVYSANDFTGNPTESDEMRPQWFTIDEIPYQDMWPDDCYWLPHVLDGHNVLGIFHFKDQSSLISYSVEKITTQT